MYVVELAFDGNPERLSHRPAHRDRLTRLKEAGRVVMAGPFADDSGALLVFDVADDAELAGLMAEDPYYRVPGVTVVGTRAWSPIVGP
jgi:hypothetical protein